MNLADITPIIITYNEAPNIGRCLDKLTWAEDIVVVDSFSTDETLAIVGGYPQARVIQRAFNGFSDQCNYALRDTALKTDWVLFLDADYILTDSLIDEVRELKPKANNAVGYKTRFQYCIQGKVLRGAFYPPVTTIFLRKNAVFCQDGHAHRIQLKGHVSSLESFIVHDDRKSFKRWFASQKKYAAEEAVKLCSIGWRSLNWKDRIRKLVFVAPLLIFFYGLFGKGLILDGWPGIVYSGQRFIAEALLSKELIK